MFNWFYNNNLDNDFEKISNHVILHKMKIFEEKTETFIQKVYHLEEQNNHLIKENKRLRQNTSYLYNYIQELNQEIQDIKVKLNTSIILEPIQNNQDFINHK